MVTNVNESFLKPKMTSSDVLFCPKVKAIQFTVTVAEKKNSI